MHSFSNACTLLSVNRATLWRWCCRAQIIPHIDPADLRRRYLDNAQLVRLARLHHRVVAVDNVNEMMLEQISELSRKVRQLEAKLEDNKKELNQ